MSSTTHLASAATRPLNEPEHSYRESGESVVRLALLVLLGPVIAASIWLDQIYLAWVAAILVCALSIWLARPLSQRMFTSFESYFQDTTSLNYTIIQTGTVERDSDRLQKFLQSDEVRRWSKTARVVNWVTVFWTVAVCVVLTVATVKDWRARQVSLTEIDATMVPNIGLRFDKKPPTESEPSPSQPPGLTTPGKPGTSPVQPSTPGANPPGQNPSTPTPTTPTPTTPTPTTPTPTTPSPTMPNTTKPEKVVPVDPKEGARVITEVILDTLPNLRKLEREVREAKNATTGADPNTTAEASQKLREAEQDARKLSRDPNIPEDLQRKLEDYANTAKDTADTMDAANKTNSPDDTKKAEGKRAEHSAKADQLLQDVGAQRENMEKVEQQLTGAKGGLSKKSKDLAKKAADGDPSAQSQFQNQVESDLQQGNVTAKYIPPTNSSGGKSGNSLPPGSSDQPPNGRTLPPGTQRPGDIDGKTTKKLTQKDKGVVKDGSSVDK